LGDLILLEVRRGAHEGQDAEAIASRMRRFPIVAMLDIGMAV